MSVGQLRDLFPRDEFVGVGPELVVARRDMSPSLPREVGVFDGVSDRVPKELAPGVEPLFLPRRVDVVEERLPETEVDLHRLRTAVVRPRIGV